MTLANLTNLLTLAGLIAMMFAMGLRVSWDDVLASIRKPRLVLSSLVANFLLVPAATVLLLYLFHANPLVSVGFLILAVCPGAPVGPPFASLARGDVPCAIGQMVILSMLSSLFSPALLGLLLGWLTPETDLQVDYLAIVETLLIAQIAPLVLGLWAGRRLPKLTARAAKPLALAANGLLLLAVLLILVREHETLAVIRMRGWSGMSLLLAASLVIGWLCGGPGQATRKTLALTTGVRNAAVGLVIVSKNFADTPAVTAVVAYALLSIFGTLGCAFLMGRMAGRVKGPSHETFPLTPDPSPGGRGEKGTRAVALKEKTCP